MQTLNDCITACNHCYDACLKEEHINMMVECIRLDRECADIFPFLAQAMGRGTPFISELAEVCVKICESCGNECKKYDHEHCQKCAEACLGYAEECRKKVA
ncbi:four-helix bundle copper-binding protein [Peribacillus frigoritolerans]|nr:four-helix bundle copper-binding protein [Peribacillus frigoritolerans]MCY9140600.1 four-helix bundle copper-binding protein [Peribacillus frigoritolerans]